VGLLLSKSKEDLLLEAVKIITLLAAGPRIPHIPSDSIFHPSKATMKVLLVNDRAIDNLIKLLIKGGTNFTHYYRLDLETYKSSDDLTGVFIWNLRTNETTFEIQVKDHYTTIKGNLALYVSVFYSLIIGFICEY
jgi:hypothetical protein